MLVTISARLAWSHLLSCTQRSPEPANFASCSRLYLYVPRSSLLWH